ncbi:hypothetical protein CONPUDRAFT_82191 [Coniophora puteana RWD-64-598 SS2]|uniref:Uncharacterized protein n=1 Tax=Coniophora puteana (strain RWD-64-598) TaxID=741705 RepID=A0A5M3MPN4_CONPW|nr:uncharacterized protein CONPUDRAFT_82191 [Coniophora puteana RWD-64-598 SS2]EIW81152.1 hypothetical protein CONPUDRAFT_82191 [Coniophora puteana RWD-64-598 SS2]
MPIGAGTSGEISETERLQTLRCCPLDSLTIEWFLPQKSSRSAWGCCWATGAAADAMRSSCRPGYLRVFVPRDEQELKLEVSVRGKSVIVVGTDRVVGPIRRLIRGPLVVWAMQKTVRNRFCFCFPLHCRSSREYLCTSCVAANARE